MIGDYLQKLLYLVKIGNMIKEVVLLIVVSITEKGITVDGHAEYAEPGKDIVCAAVSVLAQNLIDSIKDLTRDSIAYQIIPGHIDIDFKNLSERGKLLVDSFFIGINSISESYGREYVQIK